MPKVSVVIPVYNVEKYLRQCLDSVVNQTLKDIEIICIDDGSTDNSLSILKEYAAKDNRFIIKTQNNKGAGVARNFGLKLAKGEFVHFLDSDDWVATDAYEQLYNIIKNQGADLIKFKSYSYDNVKGEITTTAYGNIKWVNEKYIDNYMSINNDAKDMVKLPDSPWSGFYRLEFLKQNNIYFDNLICANDVGFFYRCITKAKRVYVSSKKLVYYRENLSSSLVTRRAEHFYCQTALYDIVKNIIKNLSPEIQLFLKERIINSVFGWYKRCYKNSLSNITKLKIKKEMYKFINQITKDNLLHLVNKNYRPIVDQLNNEKIDALRVRRKKIKNFIKNIFSVHNDGNHKVVCLFGIKIKFRRCMKGAA